MVKKKLGGGEIVGVEIRRGFWKLLQGLEHLINVLWFTFLKDYYGCYTEKRLQEDKGLKLGDKLGGYWKDPDENGSGLDEDVSGEDEKYLDSGCILKMGPTELGNRLNVGMRERGESRLSYWFEPLEGWDYRTLWWRRMRQEQVCRTRFRSLFLCYFLNTCYTFS